MRILILALLWFGLAGPASAEGPPLQAPVVAHAGEQLNLSSRGTGSATLYVIGPGHIAKRQVRLGDSIQVTGAETQAAGMYLILLCDGSGCGRAQVQVEANEPSALAFLVHPSRVAVAEPNAISAVAVVTDGFQNLVLRPTTVSFEVGVKGSAKASLPQPASHGVAWARLNSGPKEGKAEIAASVGGATEKRVVEQVASEACNLRARVRPSGGRLVLATDPIRDCKGNALPDGTIVTFTKVDKAGRSTVDAPIKKGIARTEMAYAGPATISVACGVALGSEIRIGDHP